VFFGSTTERVLRETTVPVLVTPAERPVGSSLTDIAHHVSRIVAPVDLTAASGRQVSIAAAIAGALAVPLLVTHVLEPISIPTRVRLTLEGVDTARRARVEDSLHALTSAIGLHPPLEALVVSGDPAEEIAKVTQARHANLIVMGLHSSNLLGPRMGSVTYRVLALTRTLVLAVPPDREASVATHGAALTLEETSCPR
jgi:nucleotide-binding universal stress UspA family protein